MIENKNGFTRIIHFEPAWDKCDPDPSKDYGISDVRMFFCLFKEDKGVELSINTNWHLPHVFNRRMDSIKHDIFFGEKDYLWNHMSKEFLQEICLWDLNHKECQYDGWIEFDSLNDGELIRLHEFWPDAVKVYYYWLSEFEDNVCIDPKNLVWDIFINHGEESLWQELEKIYNENF